MRENDFKKKYSFLMKLKASVKGISYAFNTERHFRFHIAATLAVVLFSFILNISKTEWLFVVYAIGCVLVAELFNTALERVVDLVSPNYNKLAGIVKDVAAGAVLIAAVQAVIIGIIVFFPYFLR